MWSTNITNFHAKKIDSHMEFSAEFTLKVVMHKNYIKNYNTGNFFLFKKGPTYFHVTIFGYVFDQ